MSKSYAIVDYIKASTGNEPILLQSKIGYDESLELTLGDLAGNEFVTKDMLDGGTGGGVTINPPVITAGTPIPFFLDASLYTGTNANFDVITKTTREDPTTGSPTGQLQRFYDMDVVDQDSVGDGTGDFTGWNVYGHDDGSGNFKYDTYLILRG